mgnify:CR=1 FL=1
MDANQADFYRRLTEIDRKHSRSRGRFVRLEERDGMLVPVDRRPVARRLPLRGLVLALIAFFGFKGFLFAYLGPVIYADRLALLEEGNAVEQAGAWVMRPDPVSRRVATWLPDF